jgi:predicted transcriptional regulator
MQLRDVVDDLGLTVLAGGESLLREVTGGYVGDLMSDAIAHAAAGGVWVTVQTHANVVAVAIMKELAGVVISGGRAPEEDTLARAVREEVPLLSSRLTSYELVERLSALGVRGRPRNARGI